MYGNIEIKVKCVCVGRLDREKENPIKKEVESD